MIKLNTPYHVAEENVTVTFTEVKSGAITGSYPNATLTGTLEGNVLSATFHNTAVNAVGLIELTFNENGFDGKWKNGLEGRNKDNAYLLLIHLSNLELKGLI